jgi:hypothetical protein
MAATRVGAAASVAVRVKGRIYGHCVCSQTSIRAKLGLLLHHSGGTGWSQTAARGDVARSGLLPRRDSECGTRTGPSWPRKASRPGRAGQDRLDSV